MKIQHCVYLFIALSIGFCCGIWFGVERVYIEVEEIPSKTTFDVISLISSILSTVCAFITTFLAIYLFQKWRHQQNESNLIQLRNNIISDSIDLNRSFNGFLVRYYRYEKENKVDELVAEVSNANLKLISKLTLYYSLEGKYVTSNGNFQKYIMDRNNDGFDELKNLLEIIRVTLGSQYLGLLEGKPGTLTYKKLENNFIGEHFNEIIGNLFNPIGLIGTSDLQVEVNRLTNSAIVDISDLNRGK
ncbi:hypothetical protein BCT62_14235 [Vibrio splendidus]|uniref:hypothetical protein n=1 Tax=Vibrio splendidus TaxID=29497 RepID=UPI000C84AD58|nr:hypothetical protein [Vibrio splendidus]PMM08987.1 hypothetical protein BCT62_14235 [Vibrio splendidus]